MPPPEENPREENLKTCALKKVYIKKEHDNSKTRALKIKIGF